MTLQYRFERHIRILENGCKIWIGAKSNGYGMFKINNKMYQSHRVARHIYCGFDLDSKLNVNHKNECSSRLCTNIDHTYEGNQSENMKDLVVFGNHKEARKTHCPQGHEYNEENTIIYNGFRKCKVCIQFHNNNRN